jgi:hypothetical protein
MNIKLIPNQWSTKVIPLTIIKHRLLPTDPTYKFVINGLIHGRSNLRIRRDSENNDYYDIDNMSVPQQAVISPIQWLEYINNNFNLELQQGENFQSQQLPELGFELEEHADLFDIIYENIKFAPETVSDGVNFIIDFGIKLSGGFIRNKLFIDTDEVKNWILDNLSFAILKMIMEKDSLTENYKIKSFYKEIYQLNKNDIELIESIFVKNSELYPLSSNDTNIFWEYLEGYVQETYSRSSLFGFNFSGAVVTEVSTKEVSFVIDQYNRPMYIQTQMKYDGQQNRVYITRSGPSVPVSTSIGYPRNSVISKDEIESPAKNLNTKINNFIYMVNKK